MAGEEERVEWREKELEQRSRQKATLSMSVGAEDILHPTPTAQRGVLCHCPSVLSFEGFLQGPLQCVAP